MRANILQLGMILGAREILATAPGQLELDPGPLADPKLLSLLEGLPEDAQLVAREFFSREEQERVIRDLARRIIENATGTDTQ